MIPIYYNSEEAIQNLIDEKAYHKMGDFGKWYDFISGFEEPKYQVILLKKNNEFFIWLRIPYYIRPDDDQDFLFIFDSAFRLVYEEIVQTEAVDEMLRRQ